MLNADYPTRLSLKGVPRSEPVNEVTLGRPRLTRRAVCAWSAAAAALPSAAACAVGAPATDQVSSQAGPPVELALWCWNYLPHVTAWERILADWYAENQRVRVRLEPQDDWPTKVAAVVAAGTTPEFMTELASQAPIKFARGWYEPLDGVYRNARIDPRKHFFVAAYEPWEFQGKPYGVPFEDTGPGFGVVIRTDFIKEVGQPVPAGKFASWDEAYDLARRLVRRDGVERWGWSTKSSQLGLWIFSAMVEAGQEYFDRSRQRFQMNTPVGIDVLKKLIWDPVHVHRIEPAEGLPAAQQMLKDGRLAMAVNSQAVLNQARLEKLESVPHLDFVIKPPFKGTDVKIIGEGGWGASLFRASQKKDTAGRFLAYLAGDKPQSIWNIALECRSSATAAAYKTAQCQQPQYAFNHRVWNVQQQGKVRHFGNEAGQPGDAYAVINKITDQLRAGTIAPKQAAELADDEMNLRHADFRAAVAAAKPS